MTQRETVTVRRPETQGNVGLGRNPSHLTPEGAGPEKERGGEGERTEAAGGVGGGSLLAFKGSM